MITRAGSRIHRHIHAGVVGLRSGAFFRAERGIGRRCLCRRCLSVLAMAYAVGPISGAHFNPAVTCGLVAAGRFDAGKAIPYIIAQVIGGVAAAVVFYVILQGAPARGKWNTFLAVSNTYGGAGFPMLSVGLIEVVTTALFLVVIAGVTSPQASPGFAPIAIGLTLVPFTWSRFPYPMPRSIRRARPRQRCSAAPRRCSRCGCSGSRPSSAASSAA